MLLIKQAIIVEGKYDKIKLSSFIDTTIIETNGFSIYKDKKKQELIRMLSLKIGIIILTDSDAAGFQIRNFIISIINNNNYINVYIPDIYGKEKRKIISSKEGKIGVEGVEKALIISAFENSGVFDEKHIKAKNEITKLQLFKDGLFGKKDSSKIRRSYQESLNLPKRLSSNSLVSILNNLFTLEEYKKHLKSFIESRDR